MKYSARELASHTDAETGKVQASVDVFLSVAKAAKEDTTFSM